MKHVLIYAITLLMLSCKERTTEASTVLPTKTIEVISFPEKIQFPSLDSLPVTANLYHLSDTSPVIVLCHQARYNKFEYTGIAKTLHQSGFNCLAIDQRSGGGMIEEFNETTLEAQKRKKPIEFLNAEPDITAAVNFAAKKYNQKIILWGSSYSSVLALYEAVKNENVKAVIGFSPGDFFDKERGSLKLKLTSFTKPMFVTSSKEEAKELADMLSKMKMNENQIQFIPDSMGLHGSRALWKTSPGNEEYWNALNNFLNKLK